MIFSLTNIPAPVETPILENTDVICFFYSPGAVQANESLWFRILLSSLKLKRSVLILETSSIVLPQVDEKRRWQVDEAWLWLAPRSLSVILASYPEIPPDLTTLKNFLKLSK